MKHTMLISGKNYMIKEELFSHFWSAFECYTCSANYEDIKNHLNRFVPDIMVHCLYEEEAVSVQTILEVQEILETNEVILVVVGAKTDCNFFVSRAPKLAKFMFEKPIDPNLISDCIEKYMESKVVDNLLNEIDSYVERKRIMVIDDDPFMLKLMTEYLKNEYEVETATSGKMAMRYLSGRPADLILLDYEMPDEAGPEVLEHLHQDAATRDIPVFFLTSMMHREMIEKALRLKPQGYLLKPVSQEKLLEAIKNLLG